MQKCGPCDSEITVEDAEGTAVLDVVRGWRRDHRCVEPDRRAGTGFAAASPATGRRHEAPGHIELDVRA